MSSVSCQMTRMCGSHASLSNLVVFVDEEAKASERVRVGGEGEFCSDDTNAHANRSGIVTRLPSRPYQ
ncbi:hypothetical protein J6590_052436 [Homalodisca vitripennis]|nr:hypothetical protein J6590_052436 [Homalodisca vitripennis]